MNYKKILIQSSMFVADLRKDFNILLENIDKEKYNVYSPITYVKEDNYYQLIGAVVALEKFDTKDINDKISIYFGPASLKLKFDYIITVKPIILEAQEFYVDNNIMPFFKDFNMLSGFHKTTSSNKRFNNIDEAIEFLNTEFLNV